LKTEIKYEYVYLMTIEVGMLKM